MGRRGRHGPLLEGRSYFRSRAGGVDRRDRSFAIGLSILRSVDRSHRAARPAAGGVNRASHEVSTELIDLLLWGLVRFSQP